MEVKLVLNKNEEKYNLAVKALKNVMQLIADGDLAELRKIVGLKQKN